MHSSGCLRRAACCLLPAACCVPRVACCCADAAVQMHAHFHTTKHTHARTHTHTHTLSQVGVLGSEKLIVNVTKVPDECGAIRTQQGDVLEVKYTGYLAETMEVRPVCPTLHCCRAALLPCCPAALLHCCPPCSCLVSTHACGVGSVTPTEPTAWVPSPPRNPRRGFRAPHGTHGVGSGALPEPTAWVPNPRRGFRRLTEPTPWVPATSRNPRRGLSVGSE